MSDNINHPAHYAEDREIEPIALIEDWDLSFSLGNAIKYISRAGRKDAEKIVEDLKKAIWYINREKEFGKFGISTIIKYNIRKWFIDAYSVEEVDTFTLDQDTFSKLSKASAIMGVSDFVIESNSKERIIKTCNNKSKSSPTFIVSQKVKGGSAYNIVMNHDNLKVLPFDYEVVVGKIKNVNIVQLVGKTVKYWIGVEA